MDDQVLDLPRGTNLAQAGISAIDYLPEALQKSRLSKTFGKHYAEVVRNIAYVLRRPGSACIPKPAAVEATLAGNAYEFFARGGKVEHALSFALSCTMEQSPLGDGTWDELEEETGGLEGDGPTYDELPSCANDLNFSLVADMLGAERPGGRRFHGGFFGEDDSDSDDDSYDEYDDMEM